MKASEVASALKKITTVGSECSLEFVLSQKILRIYDTPAEQNLDHNYLCADAYCMTI